MTRVHEGASVIVIQTRWHENDLAGLLIGEGWDHINLEAINKNGEPLWPERWPKELLERRRAEVGEYVWASLYMGSPRPRGGTVFSPPTYYDKLPDDERRYWIGVDLAYTAKTHSDYSVALVLCETGGKFYVVDMVREQMAPPQFRDRVKGLALTYPNATMCVGVTGSETGSAYYMEELGLPLNIQKATADKFSRAIPVAAAWGAGSVLIPEQAWWLDDFKKEVMSFSGVGDARDDIIDALSAGYNAAKYGACDWSVIEEAMRSVPKALDW
jgi:predicted phage terminase large subunit-like protein